MAGDAQYYTADQLIEEARRQHQMLSEPADDDARQLYTGSCTGCEWTTRESLDAHTLQEVFDKHLATMQKKAHRLADSAKEVNQSTDPEEIAELRGAFSDGYTSDDINRVFGIFQDVYGQTLVCRWSVLDEGWYQGTSEFYFEEGHSYYYDGGIYAWLSGDPNAPVNLGGLLQWRGSPVPDSDTEGPQHAVTDDGFHNCALVDEDR